MTELIWLGPAPIRVRRQSRQKTKVAQRLTRPSPGLRYVGMTIDMHLPMRLMREGVNPRKQVPSRVLVIVEASGRHTSERKANIRTFQLCSESVSAVTVGQSKFFIGGWSERSVSCGKNLACHSAFLDIPVH